MNDDGLLMIKGVTTGSYAVEPSEGGLSGAGLVLSGEGFRSWKGSHDWSCGPCGELLLGGITQVDNWRFYASGDAYIDGELAHQCPVGYSRTRLPIVDITKHEQQGAE